MKPCQYEYQIIAAAKAGQITEPLQQHLVTCPSCQETYAVVIALSHAADVTQTAIPPMVSPNLLWLKAELDVHPKSQARLHLLSAAIMVLALVVGQMLYRLLWAPKESAPTLTTALPAPFSGSPVPLDAGLVVIVLAVVLVLVLPQTISARPTKSRHHSLLL